MKLPVSRREEEEVGKMCIRDRKKRVHQVSTYLTQEDDTELIWFFTQDITDVIKKRDELRELNLLLDGILNNLSLIHIYRGHIYHISDGRNRLRRLLPCSSVC